MKNRITHVRYDDDGISNVKLDNGTELTVEAAVEMAKRHEIEEVCTGVRRGADTRRTLKSVKNSSVNLSDLPRF